MKKIAFLILTFLISNFFSQTRETSDTLSLPSKTENIWVIKINIPIILLNLLHGSVNTLGQTSSFDYYAGTLTLEKGFLKRHSVQLTGNYTYYNYVDKYSRQVWHLIPEYKFFLSKKKNFVGFYLGIYSKFQYQTERLKNDPFLYASPNRLSSAVYKGIGGGGIFGFQLYFKKHFTVDCFLGYGPNYTNRTNFTSIFNGFNPKDKYYVEWVFGRSGINLGYKW